MGEILIRSDPERIPQRFLHVPAESSGGIFSRPGRRSAPFRGSVGGIRIDPDVILHLRRCECVCVCVWRSGLGLTGWGSSARNRRSFRIDPGDPAIPAGNDGGRLRLGKRGINPGNLPPERHRFTDSQIRIDPSGGTQGLAGRGWRLGIDPESETR